MKARIRPARIAASLAVVAGLTMGGLALSGGTASADTPTATVVSVVLPTVQPVAIVVVDTLGLNQSHTSGIYVG